MTTKLYLITPPIIDDFNAFAARFERALKAGLGTAAEIACLQIRLKSSDGVSAKDSDIIALTRLLLPIAHAHNCIILINDRADLAKQSGADGVHLGQQDGSVGEARRLLGEEASIGVTCHNSAHLAMVAGEEGADYVAFGAFYPTGTKTPPSMADPELLAWWSHATTLPSVAIGGITPENAAPLVKAGADFLAVSAGVWNHAEGEAAAIVAFAKVLAG